VEGVDGAVLAHVPALGERRHGREILAEDDERVADVLDDHRRGRVGCEARVERRRLGSDRDSQYLLRRLLGRRRRFHGRCTGLGRHGTRLGGRRSRLFLVAAAACRGEGEDSDQGRNEQEPGVSTHFCPP